MGKKIAKVIFIFVGIIFTLLAYVIAYNSGASTNYYELMKQATSAESHDDPVKAFSTYNIPYDKNALVKANEGEKNELVIYNGVNLVNLSYYETVDNKTSKTSYSKIQDMYYLFIFNPNFNYGTIDSTNKNDSGIKFYNEAGDKSFTFYFVVNSTVNSGSYLETAYNPTDSLFKTERNVVETYKSYGFILTSMPEIFINKVKEELGGDIAKLELVDNRGDVVSGTTVDAKLDFSQEFYKDIEEFKNASNVINEIGSLSSSAKTKEQEEAYEKAVEYVNNFNVADYADKGYAAGYKKDDVYTTSLIWSSIGIAALFLFAVAIIYVLVFYFVRIKNWIFSGRHANRGQRIVPNKIRPANQTPAPKTNFDRLNEKRAEDLAKKRAKEEEIKKHGNMIMANKQEELPKGNTEENKLDTTTENTEVVDVEVVNNENSEE